MTEMKTSEVLNLAADTVQGRGWTSGPISTSKGNYDPWGRGGSGPVCLEGAIYAALGEPFELPILVNNCPAGMAVREYLETPHCDYLHEWNDYPGRRAEEAVEVLRACALIEAAKENATVSELVAA